MDADEFVRIGRRLFAEHLVGGNFGNISIRDGDRGFYIKRSGAYLDVAGELVLVPLEGEFPAGASSECRVHRAVYARTSHQAVVHAHPPAAVALSLICNEVIPEDSEGRIFCPRIPVVEGAPGTQDLADAVAGALVNGRLVIARGHGTFAAGGTLDEAFLFTSLGEHACRVLAIKQSFFPR